MPRSDRRKPTLRERAAISWRRNVTTPSNATESRIYEDGYLAGHRANRLTKAERAVVEAAMHQYEKAAGWLSSDLLVACGNLKRAKGRK